MCKCLDRKLLSSTLFWLKFDFTGSISKTLIFIKKFTLYDNISTSFYFENSSRLINMITIFTDYKHLIMTLNLCVKYIINK